MIRDGFEAGAKALGMSPADVRAALKDGKTSKTWPHPEGRLRDGQRRDRGRRQGRPRQGRRGPGRSSRPARTASWTASPRPSRTGACAPPAHPPAEPRLHQTGAVGTFRRSRLRYAPVPRPDPLTADRHLIDGTEVLAARPGPRIGVRGLDHPFFILRADENHDRRTTSPQRVRRARAHRHAPADRGDLGRRRRGDRPGRVRVTSSGRACPTRSSWPSLRPARSSSA